MRFFLYLLFASSLFGSYTGNIASPAIMNSGFFSAQNPFLKATTGYIADYTNNKRYVGENFDAFRKFSIHSQMASFSLIFVERLEIFAAMGGSKERTKMSTQDALSIWTDFTSTYQFSWSTGAKAVLIQWGPLFLGGDFTYFTIPSSPKSYFRFFNRLNLPLDLTKQKTSLTEWQTSLGLALRLFFLTPYGGATYQHSRLHIGKGPEIGSLTYHNRFAIGYFYGLTLSVSGKIHINVEKRVRDEFGYTLATTAVF